jgi:hypothetical protein
MPHHVGHCCTNVVWGYCCVCGHSCISVVRGYCATVSSSSDPRTTVKSCFLHNSGTLASSVVKNKTGMHRPIRLFFTHARVWRTPTTYFQGELHPADFYPTLRMYVRTKHVLNRKNFQFSQYYFWLWLPACKNLKKPFWWPSYYFQKESAWHLWGFGSLTEK